MDHWLYITNSANWKVTEKTNILGANERYRTPLSRMEIGDRVLIYLISEPGNEELANAKIVAEYEAESRAFEDSSRIFHAPPARDEIYKIRVKLRPLKEFKNPVEFRSLVKDLGFIKNKTKWGTSIRGRAVIRIPEEDYRFITSKLQ